MKKYLLASSVVAAVLFTGCCSDKDEKKSTYKPPVAIKHVETSTKAVTTTAVATTAASAQVVEPKKVVAKTGKELFAKCSSCHGSNAEKKALGKSQIIKGWDKQKVSDALNGYKNGTYGGDMKGIMKGQVATLSNEDIDKLSTFIASIK